MNLQLTRRPIANTDAGPIVALASELIRSENTSADRINECAGYCANWLRHRGADTTEYEYRGLKSVVAKVGQGSPVVVLNGHLDVVPGEPQDFVPRMENGRLYGRGSYDMLGSVACLMTLMAEFAQSPPDCTVILALVPDEESGGELGTGYLVDRGVVGDIAICGEPTNLNIAVQAKGILQLWIEVRGVAAHGSRPWLGENAIIKALENYQTISSLNAFEQNTAYFASPSLNLAKIHAGKAFNQVPDACSIGVDIRYLPGQDPDQLLRQIRSSLPDADVRVHFHGSPVHTSEDDRLVRRLRKHARSVFFGQDGSADTRFYATTGMPAVEFGPSGANHHGPDEYVDIQSLSEYTDILRNFITTIKDDEDEI